MPSPHTAIIPPFTSPFHLLALLFSFLLFSALFPVLLSCNFLMHCKPMFPQNNSTFYMYDGIVAMDEHNNPALVTVCMSFK